VARKPQSPEPTRWAIYRAARKAIWLGEVEATDEREAIEKAAKKFRMDAAKVIAVRRQ
jgi:hypothetical protein